MAATDLHRIYHSDPAGLTALYDGWAAHYESDMAEAVYATPTRLSHALAYRVSDKRAPLLDFGCGTGLGGQALAKAGFTTMDGCDPSHAMMAQARGKGIYRNLWQLTPDGALPFDLTAYGLVTAIDVISVGAAPPETFDLIADQLRRGALFALSFNGYTLQEPAYTDRLDQRIESGDMVLKSAALGPHLLGIGVNSKIFLLEKR